MFSTTYLQNLNWNWKNQFAEMARGEREYGFA